MKAYELLDSPKKYTTYAYARDAEGKWCPAKDPEACCWCLIGALQRCYPDFDVRQELYQRICIKLGISPDYLTAWGDSHSFNEVVGVLKELDI
jgi:hypothetical protein